jgi:hypothetical protein
VKQAIRVATALFIAAGVLAGAGAARAGHGHPSRWTAIGTGNASETTNPQQGGGG